MRLTLSLYLPREARSVTSARHLLRAAISDLDVDDGFRHDVELALTEACTNVLDHAEFGDDYMVEFEVSDEAITFRVTDSGGGLPTMPPGRPIDDERGRGIALMHALVDQLHFSASERGHTVHLEKRLPRPPAA